MIALMRARPPRTQHRPLLVFSCVDPVFGRPRPPPRPRAGCGVCCAAGGRAAHRGAERCQPGRGCLLARTAGHLGGRACAERPGGRVQRGRGILECAVRAPARQLYLQTRSEAVMPGFHLDDQCVTMEIRPYPESTSGCSSVNMQPEADQCVEQPLAENAGCSTRSRRTPHLRWRPFVCGCGSCRPLSGPARCWARLARCLAPSTPTSSMARANAGYQHLRASGPPCLPCSCTQS